MEKLNLKELKKVDTEKIGRMVFQKVKEMLGDGEDSKKNYHLYSIACAYILYKMQSTIIYESYNEFWKNNYQDMPKEIKDLLIKCGYGIWDVLQNMVGKFSIYELLAFILYDNKRFDGFSREASTPAGVLALANYFLDIKDSEEVLEICSGKGNFLVEATTEGMKANYVGMELNRTVNEIANFRAAMIRENFQYTLRDVLDFEDNNNVLADKIFANYPFNLKNSNIMKYQNSIENKFNMSKKIFLKASSDWYFNLVVLNHLKEKGKAVVIMSSGSMWNNSDQEMRKYFIRKGFVEAVISLPSNIMENSSIATSLVVLSKNNDKITFVDARDNYIAGRRKNEISEDNVKEIIKYLESSTEKKVVKTIREIADKNFTLNVNQYLDTMPVLRNGVLFESVIINIQRGVQCKSSEFEAYRSSMPTNYQILQLANIADGIISKEEGAEYLTEIPDKFLKYCIKNHALIISKTGTPVFKTAIVEKDDRETLIASGNLLVVELDEKKINPFYLQAFLMSDLGMSILNSIHTGTVIPIITLDNLRKMMIPLPSRDEQERIANEFLAALDKTVMLKRQLEKSKMKMKQVFEEGGKYC